MLWIGLTGGIASGKSTVSHFLRARGLDVIDADVLAREAVAKNTPTLVELVRLFGSDILQNDGELDRKKMAQIIFNDPRKRELLESITHPRVRELAKGHRERLQKAGRAIAFYDVPLLFEKNMRALFDRTVVVSCDRATQRQRLIERDGFSVEEADRRLNSQLPIEEKIKQADDVIENHGTVDDLEKNVDRYLAKLKKIQP